MKTLTVKHPGFRHVGGVMRWIVEHFAGDVAHLRGLSLDGVFAYVEGIPYTWDGEILGNSAEIVSRPSRFFELPGLDCKKKSILIACWAHLNGLPFRFVAVDDSGRGVSHVFPLVFHGGEWWTMDATIPGLYRPGSPMPSVLSAEVIG